MKRTLIFQAADVRRVVEHSLASPRQHPQVVDYDKDDLKAITQPVEAPAVLFVHDDGVYLMSNGDPRDLADGDRAYVAYARGCNPKKDARWYDTARDLVGGDDFVETLPWAREIKAQLDSGAAEIGIEVTGTNVALRPARSRK